jgi:hypothetical protein
MKLGAAREEEEEAAAAAAVPQIVTVGAQRRPH